LEWRASGLECASPLALSEGVASSEESFASGGKSGRGLRHSKTLRDVRERAAQTLKWAELGGQGSLLDIALDHLTLGRAALYAAILIRSSRREEAHSDLLKPKAGDGKESQSLLTSAATEIDAAVSGLRRAASQDHIPRGLLTRAWLRFLTGARTGPESAQEDLDEAWEIAERGPMKLFMADLHLHRARLFGGRTAEGGGRSEEAGYPWTSPRADLAAAEEVINKCSYHRRDEELADAKRAILGSA
jgi:hypothetical protein